MRTYIIGLLLVFASCQRYADPATYILPKDRKGPFIVIFSQRSGEPATFRDGRRLYVIPPTGVLQTRFDYQDGWRDDRFLMKSDKGYDTLDMGDTSGMNIRYNTFLKYYPKIFDSDKQHNLDSSFMYEIFTAARAHEGWDTLYQTTMDSLIFQADRMIQEATQIRRTVK